MENIISESFGNKSAFKLLKYLAKNRVSLSGRQIAKKTRLSPQTVHQILQKLARLKIVRLEKIGSSFVYQLNQEHLFIQKCLLPTLELGGSWTEMIGQYYMNALSPKPVCIILFGSHAKGKATASSDLDLLFLYKDKDFSENHLSEINRFSSQVSKMCGYQPIPIVAKLSDFKQQAKQGAGLMRTVVREGNVIAGALMSEVIINDTEPVFRGA